MDGSHHLASVGRFHAPSPAPPVSRSQTSGPNEIDFSIPDVRPGLAKLGRRLTEMSENYFYDETKGASDSKRGSRTSMDLAAKVPFMGDEPVFCPFCNKPLPPALLLQHMSTATEEMDKADQMGKVNKRLSGVESSSMTKTTSAPVGGSSTASPAKNSATPVQQVQRKPSGISSSRPVSPVKSTQLAASVKEADEVDHAASKVLVDNELLRKWSKIAGVQLDLPQPAKEPESGKISNNNKKGDSATSATTKPFPKIAPPPEDQSRSSSRNSSRFNLFGKGKAKDDGQDEEDDSDDDRGGNGGYARLDAPASPERAEAELPSLAERSAARQEAQTEVLSTSSTVPEALKSDSQPASEAEIRELLKEVLTKINDMSKSHTSVLHSHSTLLTTLKIARSNLAMAEANAEMLEEQLKRQTAQVAKTPMAPAAPKPPTTTSMGPPTTLPARTATTTGTTGQGSSAAPITTAKAEAPVTPRRSADGPTRPQSIQIPTSAHPMSPVSASSESSKGMFGSFWSRNKDKVGVFMSNLPDMTPVAEKSSFDFARSPTTSAVPYGAALPEQYRSPALNRSKTVHGKTVESDGLGRSSSYTNVQAAAIAGTSPRVPTDPYTQELSRLRHLHQSSQTKIEALTKEVAEMKKGKVEMEAELENLSQALFEEANKMVATEKKRVAELEESLKEVKEEREALRQTIKVLGGQVEDKSSSKGDADEEQDELGDMPDFEPRDLDKHYEALRKSIHHVADGGEWHQTPVVSETRATRSKFEDEAVAAPSTDSFTTPIQQRRHSLPDISSPEPQSAPALHDPWADSTPAKDIARSPNRPRFQLTPLDDADVGPTDTSSLGLQQSSTTDTATGSNGPVSPKAEKLDALDEMMEKMQADVELESPKKEKKNPIE